MINISNMQPVVRSCYLNLFSMIIRSKNKKSDMVIKVISKRREEKLLFGPVKKRKQKKKIKIDDSDLKRELDSNKMSKCLEINDKDSELTWTINAAKEKTLRILKMNEEICQDAEKILSKQTEGLKINKITKTDINNYVINNNVYLAQKKNVLDGSPDNVPNFSPKLSNESNISKESKLTHQLMNFPLINTTKSDKDQWESSTILSRALVDKKDFALPGVTRILHETMPEQSRTLLENWKQRMILKLGEEGFAKYMKGQKENSKMMHTLIQQKLNDEPVEIPDILQDTFRSINSILKNINNVRLIESHVTHQKLRYRGIIDCVADYRDNLCVIDWKKSDKIKMLSTTYDLPLQLSAYVGALNSDPNYPFKVKTGILAIAYSRGQPPSVFEFSAHKLEFYWKEWLKRLEKYYSMKFTESL